MQSSLLHEGYMNQVYRDNLRVSLSVLEMVLGSNKRYDIYHSFPESRVSTSIGSRKLSRIYGEIHNGQARDNMCVQPVRRLSLVLSRTRNQEIFNQSPRIFASASKSFSWRLSFLGSQISNVGPRTALVSRLGATRGDFASLCVVSVLIWGNEAIMPFNCLKFPCSEIFSHGAYPIHRDRRYVKIKQAERACEG